MGILDALKGLFDQRTREKSLEEIRTALKEKIPTLNIPLSSENTYAERKVGSFTFPVVKDKNGQEYDVALIVDANYSPESLMISVATPGSGYSLFEKIHLIGPDADQDLLKLINDNPKILA